MLDVIEYIEITAIIGAVWWFARWSQRLETAQKLHAKRLAALEALEQERTESDEASDGDDR